MIKVRKINYFIFFSLLVILAYWSHLFIFGEDTFIRIHDNLDSLHSSFILDGSSKYWFIKNSGLVTEVMSGFQRVSLPSELNLVTLLYYVFRPFVALSINMITISVISFFSMRFFLKTIDINGHTESPDNLINCVSLCFALLPFYPLVGGTVALLPFIWGAFNKIEKNKLERPEMFLLFLVPFYSSYFLGPVFLMAVLFLVSLFKKKVSLKYVILFVLLNLLYLAVNWRLILFALYPTFISHRVEFSSTSISVAKGFKLLFLNLLKGQSHVATFHSIVIIPISILAFLKACYTKNTTTIKLMLLFSSLIIISAAIYSFWNYGPINSWRHNYFLLKAVNWSRIHWLQPLFWYSLFYISLFQFKNIFFKRVRLIYLLVFFQVLILFNYSDYNKEKIKSNVTYKEFYAAETFNEIKKVISKNDYVVSIGIHPAVATFNGMNSFDYYATNYPLEHKNKIKRIISNELEKNNILLDYFSKWGSRAYIFSSELMFDFLAKNKTKSIRIDLNYSEIEKNRVRYIISTVKINQPDKLIAEYLDVPSYGSVFLYKVF